MGINLSVKLLRQQFPQGNGSPIRVAVLDSGILDTHQALQTNIVRDKDHDGVSVYGYNACTDDENLRELPKDGSGHGTHVAGIIAGDPDVITIPNNSETLKFRGVASVPGMVELLICKMTETDQDVGFADRAIKCIRYAREHRARVINCSWSGGRDDAGEFSGQILGCIKTELSNDPPYQFKKKDAAGNEVWETAPSVVAVTAAGNLRDEWTQEQRNKDNYHMYPASLNLPNVIAVAATGKSRTIAEFSCYGKKSIHIAAPGEDIISAHHTADKCYRHTKGTSMAAPQVAAAAALVMQRFPGLSPQKIVGHLGDTACKMADDGDINVHLDLGKALEAEPDSPLTELEGVMEKNQNQIKADQLKKNEWHEQQKNEWHEQEKNEWRNKQK